VWFDAHSQIAGAARMLAENVMPGLLSMGDDAAPAPSLAKYWRWEEPTVASIEVFEGRYFANGRPLDAEAISRNLERAVIGGPQAIFNAAEFSTIRRIEVTGTYGITLRLERPFAPIFGLLANGFGIVDLSCGEPPANSTGAGAFALTAMTGSRMRLSAVERPGFAVDWRFCTTGPARARRVRSGRADVLIGEQGSKAALACGWSRIVQHALGPTHLTFNLRRWPTSDLGFRRATAEAIDRHEVLKSGFGGLGRLAYAPYPDDSAFPVRAAPVETSAPKPPRPAGSELVLAVGGGAFRRAAAVVARTVRRALGFDVRVVSVPNPDWWPGYYMDGDWDLALQTWTPMPDPHIVYARRYASGGMHNAPRYANPKFDQIVDAAARVTDLTRRLELYAEAETLRAADLPTLYLVYPDRTAWIRPGISGLVLRPSWAVELAEVGKLERPSCSCRMTP